MIRGDTSEGGIVGTNLGGFFDFPVYTVCDCIGEILESSTSILKAPPMQSVCWLFFNY